MRGAERGAAQGTQRPILVTGCPRSGTTFVGKVIGQSPEVFYIYEPFNDEAPHHLDLPERFVALGASGAETGAETGGHGTALDAQIGDMIALGRPAVRWRKAMLGALEFKAREPDLAGRLAAREFAYRRESFARASRVCIKDPLAFFAAEYLADAHDAQVVVMVRHPASVISSYLALDWPSEMGAIEGRDLALDDAALAAEVAGFDPAARPNIDGLILQWRLFATATLELAERRPDWIFVIHDDLCLDPETHMRAMFDALGLTFGDAIAGRLRRDTTHAAPESVQNHSQHRHRRNSRELVDGWRDRLEPAVADRIMAETEVLWERVQATLRPDYQFESLAKKDGRQNYS